MVPPESAITVAEHVCACRVEWADVKSCYLYPHVWCALAIAHI